MFLFHIKLFSFENVFFFCVNTAFFVVVLSGKILKQFFLENFSLFRKKQKKKQSTIFELVEFCNNFLLRQEYVGIFLVCCRFVLY